MTDRERIFALAEGLSLDRTPIVSWPCPDQAPSGVSVRLPSQTLIAKEGTLLLAEIVNPFGLAIERGLDLNDLLKTDPEGGGCELDRLSEEVKSTIEDVLRRGADGILYRLHGACPRWCTPMQYGGYYLERDRELLGHAKGALFNVLFVAGDEEVYFDFVSDLPAHAFGWDSSTTGVSEKDMRSIRQGLLISDDPQSDILLSTATGSITQALESPAKVEINV